MPLHTPYTPKQAITCTTHVYLLPYQQVHLFKYTAVALIKGTYNVNMTVTFYTLQKPVLRVTCFLSRY
jgi:hypothetical protein